MNPSPGSEISALQSESLTGFVLHHVFKIQLGLLTKRTSCFTCRNYVIGGKAATLLQPLWSRFLAGIWGICLHDWCTIYSWIFTCCLFSYFVSLKRQEVTSCFLKNWLVEISHILNTISMVLPVQLYVWLSSWGRKCSAGPRTEILVLILNMWSSIRGLEKYTEDNHLKNFKYRCEQSSEFCVLFGWGSNV